MSKACVKSLFLIALSIGAGACGAGVAPAELHSARDALSKADTTNAPKVAPVKLEEAKQALAEAEAAFSDRADDAQVKTLAHIALRKAEVAVATANTVLHQQAVQQAEKDKMSVQAQALDSTQRRLTRTEEEKRRLDEAAKKGEAEVQRVHSELDKERLAREAAEKKAAAAMASLAQIAAVKEESRGVVITLSGSVLFATGAYQLLPIAREKLNEVAKALKDQGYKRIVVEGHTDSRGSDSKNQELSLQRAQEVRSYLVSQGIDSNKIEAAGIGEARPIADNASPEGRANNRRVELVVTPE